VPAGDVSSTNTESFAIDRQRPKRDRLDSMGWRGSPLARRPLIADLLSYPMDSGRTLRLARRRRGLTQRQLAARSGVPQSAIARIESGRVTPRVDSLDRLLRFCGETLESRPARGVGVDRSLIREMLRLSPTERLKSASIEANHLARLLRSAR